MDESLTYCRHMLLYTLDIAPLHSESPSQKRSGMARVHKGFHSFTCTPTSSSAIGMSHTCLCLPSYNWYSFTDPGRMEGWVDPRWWSLRHCACAHIRLCFAQPQRSPAPRCRTPVNLRERWRNPRHHRLTRLPDQKWVDICHCTLKHPSRCRKQKHGTTDCNLQLICN